MAIRAGAKLLGLLLAFDISLGFNGFTYPLLYDYIRPFRGLRHTGAHGPSGGVLTRRARRYGRRSADRSYLYAIGAPRARCPPGCRDAGGYASRPLTRQIIPTAAPGSYADAVKDRGDSPTATLFEYPASSLDDPTYMYYSTFHWQNLVNGYAGFFPPWYGRLTGDVAVSRRLLVATVKTHGARYILVHGERLIGNRYRRSTYELDAWPGLTLLSRRPAERQGQHGEISVYRVSYGQ